MQTYASTFVYSRFSPKIQFFTVCLMALWGGPMVEIFEIQFSRLPENAFPTLSLTAEA